MERLTVLKDGKCTVDNADEALLRLAQYENMYDSLMAELAKTLEKLEAMSAQGKNKSTTYMQLLTTKLTLKDLIGRVDIYVR